MRRVPRRILIVGVAVASLAIGVVSIHAGEADDLRDRAGELEGGLGALTAAEDATVLQLFALESDLSRASRRVTRLTAQASRVEDATDLVREQTQIARRAVETAEEGLAERVRTLYMTDDVDSLEVILGARSVQDAIDGIGALQRTVSRDGEIVAQVSQARRNAIDQRDELRRRQARVDQLVADATLARESVEQSRSERATFLRSLRDELELSRREIVALRERAASLEARAAEIQAQTTTSSVNTTAVSEGAAPPAQPPEASTEPAPPSADAAPAPAPTPPPAPGPTPPPSPPPSIEPDSGGGPRAGSQMTVIATAYAIQGTTAVGVQTQLGIIAVDPSVIPLGTKMSVPGYGDGIAADTGSAVTGAKIDVWLPTLAEARAWGRRTVTITFK